MNNYGPIQMPNAQLAQAAITAGIPFASPEEGGPCRNEYTPGFLRDRRIIGENGVELRELELRVLETAERGIAGHVTYFFERTPEAESFIKAWDTISETIRLRTEYDSLTNEERACLDKPPELPVISNEIIAQVLCIHANNMRSIVKLPFVHSPVCNTLAGKSTGERKATSTGVMTGNTAGAGKIWSTDLPNTAAPDKPSRESIGIKHTKIRDWKSPYAK